VPLDEYLKIEVMVIDVSFSLLWLCPYPLKEIVKCKGLRKHLAVCESTFFFLSLECLLCARYLLPKPLIFFVLVLLLYHCCTEGTLWQLQKCLHYTLHPLHHSPLSPFPILRIVSTGFIFSFLHLST
jgi:hypothetical protein